MLKYIACFFSSLSLVACPYCAGASDASDKYTYIFLAVFIALTYIPISLLFKIARKHKTKKHL